MKKIIRFACYATIIACLANWGEQETTVEGRKKNKINIYGTLEIYQLDDQGNPRIYKVDNIAIAKLFEKIPVYAKPSPADYDPQTYILKVDPTKKYLKTFIDLVTEAGGWETVEIRVDNPGIIWKYKKKEYSTEVEYVEIIFKSNDEQGTEQHYIIDLRKKLTADEINDAGPKEMEVPLESIKRLKIEGYEHRDANKQDQQKKEPDSYKPHEIEGTRPQGKSKQTTKLSWWYTKNKKA